MNNIYSKLFSYFAILFLLGGCITAVRDINYRPLNIRTIKDSLQMIYFSLYTGEKPIMAKDNCRYYWFANNRIQQSVGDYSGHLLHGTYSIFTSGGALHEKGVFKYGLKTDTWTEWEPSGDIKYRIKYSKGEVKDTVKTSWTNKKLTRNNDKEIDSRPDTTNLLHKVKRGKKKQQSHEKK